MIYKKARIALYVPSLRGGGAERVMVNLANGFAARGHPVDLIVAKAEGPYLEHLTEKVRLVDLKVGRVIKSLPGLVHYLRAEKPAVLLSAMGHANVVAAIARLASRAPTRVVISEHSNLSISRKNARSFWGRNMIWLMRWTYRRVDGVVTVSGGVADDLVEQLSLHKDEVAVVYNPIVDQSLVRLSGADPCHQWFESQDVPVILSVGRLEPPKDFPTLLEAFAKLRRSRDVRLVILGEGSLSSQLKELARRLGVSMNVDLPGFVDNPYAFMRKADLFVLSSAWEGFGNVLVEAMACGTPVVSTACPSGPDEILENGRWGRLVPVGDVDALAAAMAATLDENEHPDVATRAGEFSVDRAVDGYLEVMLPEPNEQQS